MKHSMKLFENAFERIKSENKTIEIRLYDEKRRTLNPGDFIEFSKLPKLEDKLNVEILALYRYASFKDLIRDHDMQCFGHSGSYHIDDFLTNIYKIYSKEDEQLYGVLGIRIKVVKDK